MTLEIARDFLENALPELETYILSKTLYWQIGSNRLPLTIGNLLLEDRILYAYDRTLSREFQERVAIVHSKWAVAWQNKAEREFANRLLLWSDFLSGAKKEDGMSAAHYRANVRQRAILTLLAGDVEIPRVIEKLAAADAKLRAVQKQAEFVWERELRDVFSRDEFWYLY